MADRRHRRRQDKRRLPRRREGARHRRPRRRTSGGARTRKVVTARRLQTPRAQHQGQRAHPPDIRDHGALRGRGRLQSGADGLHLHGARHQPHVHHRAGRHRDGDRRTCFSEESAARVTIRRREFVRRPGVPRVERPGIEPHSQRSALLAASTSRTRRASSRGTTPSASTTDLAEVVPDQPRKPYDIHDVLDGVLDEGSFFGVQETSRETSSWASRGWTASRSASSPISHA